MKVKDTYLSKIRLGDIGFHVTKGILSGDVLGDIIVAGEGNRGRDEDGDGKREPGRSSGNYTHCVIVTKLPDPEAEVQAVRTDKDTGRTTYKVIDKKKSGLKCHATWPVIKEESIDWSETHFELWRVREISRSYTLNNNQTPPEVYRMIKWAREKKGRIYNFIQFITFGLFKFSNSWICSHFCFDACYESTQFMDYPIILSPDGMFDELVTPNDLINSGKMIRTIYQGALPN